MTDFERLVSEMRIAQKEYFRTRATDLLKKAKTYEQMVDLYLEDVRKLELAQWDVR